MPPTKINGVLGIAKAYSTRVGDGPFPTELRAEPGDLLRTRGNEFGSVTGRPRRCGWADAVALRYAARINGFDSIALTKLDVLDALETVQICVGYRYAGDLLTDFPEEERIWNEAEPVAGLGVEEGHGAIVRLFLRSRRRREVWLPDRS